MKVLDGRVSKIPPILMLLVVAGPPGSGCDCGSGEGFDDADVAGDVRPESDVTWPDDGGDGPDDGAPPICDEGHPCPERGRCETAACVAGECVYTPLCTDDVPCTIDERCDPETGACSMMLDHALCPAGELCTETGCTAVPCPDCDDGYACNGIEVCDEDGLCRPGMPPCGDGIDCTRDSCVEPGECSRIPDDSLCPDDRVCDPSSGCVSPCGADRPCPDDGFTCTPLDLCIDGRCVPSTEPICPEDTASCTGTWCMEGRTPPCVTVPMHEHCGTGRCDPTDPAAGADGCVAAWECGAGCDDGFWCNGLERCVLDGTAYRCAAGAAPEVSDGVDCTLDYCDETADRVVHVRMDGECGPGAFCDPVLGCAPTPCTSDASCDDGNPCNGREQCLPEDAGRCRPGTPLACDDRIDCTLDACNPAAAGGDPCTHTPRHDWCGTPGAMCMPAAGGCVDSPCLSDATCGDGSVCNGVETCGLDGRCRPGTPLVCGDAFSCTADSCVDPGGCRNDPRDAFCRDGSFCNGDERCDPTSAGRDPATGCVAGAPVDCRIDAPPCTRGACSDASGECIYTPIDDDRDGYGPASVPGCSPGGDCNDGNRDIHPAAVEICNAADDDCDALTDEGFDCRFGASTSCPTLCGSVGRATCGSTCTWGGCVAPAEACNGIDDDCDGATDEGFGCAAGTTRPCNVGTCVGTQTCSLGCVWNACVPPAEVCDGTDNDCDTVTDEGFDCVRGEFGSCTTSCGSTGDRVCSETCNWGFCRPPREICNGRDDDCDGFTDNGYVCPAGATGSCPTSCGTTGSRTCNASCTWGACAPPAETCNGRDDDCDTACDNGFGCCARTESACTTSCGSDGTRYCSSACALGPCVPPAESCNGLDDDCDTVTDNGFDCIRGEARACATSCGTTGTKTCSSDCLWNACVPPTEICNGRDDDCDGATDDGFLCIQGSTRGCMTSLGCPGTESCRSDCGGWTGECIATGTPPANDRCSAPTPLTAPGGVLIGSTCPGADDYAGSCGGAGALDVVYRFTITVPSDVLLHTVGAVEHPFATALYVRSGTCAGGTELACDAGRFGNGSLVQLDNVAPGTYYVFVDGAAGGQAGGFRLEWSISPHYGRPGDTCGRPAETGLGATVVIEAAGTYTGNTTGFIDDATGTCRSSSGPDAVFLLYVPTSRPVTISTCPIHGDPPPTPYDTFLYVRRVCTAAGDEVPAACNDDATPECAWGSNLSRISLSRLDPGLYAVFVDGGGAATSSGAFVLEVDM
jgi:hypothetical protein